MAYRGLMGGACALALALSFVAADAQTLEQRFEAPSKEARPRLRWWWPGAAVSDAELRREIDLMDANGFGGAEIASFTPNFVTLTPQERAVVNDYGGPAEYPAEAPRGEVYEEAA